MPEAQVGLTPALSAEAQHGRTCNVGLLPGEARNQPNLRTTDLVHCPLVDASAGALLPLAGFFGPPHL